MHYLITGITCLILAGSLYGLRLQNYPYQDIWPWTGLNFNTNHIVTDPKQLDNVAEQPLLVQLKGEFEPYLESDGYFWPKLYWNSDPKPLLPAMVAPEGNRYISVNMLFIHKFKIQQGLITKNNYNYRVTFPQFDPLLEPYETYYQALFTAQRNNGAILTIYGPQPSSLPSYQLSDNAVTILNNISQRNNRKPLEINGKLTSFFSISSDGTRQKEYHIIINPERFRMIKINGFNLLLILLYTIPALLFSVGCIMMNKVNASRRV